MTGRTVAQDRYQKTPLRRCGRSGVHLPIVSVGLWHNFGGVDAYETGREILLHAFDQGIYHFDLANNYGPPPGSAEEMFGKVLRTNLAHHRDELIVTTKAGYRMGPGPFGEWGSRKYLLSSLDQSLRRMGVDYVDIFYSHRPDPDTPLEETMGALADAVRGGKPLYAGISNYSADDTRTACRILRDLGTTCLIHQPKYSMLERWVEAELLDTLAAEGVGCVCFSPLAQGLLTDRYLDGIPADSRMAKSHGFLHEEARTPQLLEQLRELQRIAQRRNQTLAQMSLAWLLKDSRLTSVLIGASSVAQLQQNLDCRQRLEFDTGELAEIDRILGHAKAN